MAATCCTVCGVEIQDWVSGRTGGLCMPFLAGPVKCSECGKPMMRQPVLKDAEHVCIKCLKKRPASTEEVEFNGIWMAADWPAKIIAAQDVETVDVEGKTLKRVRYGSEKNSDLDYSLPCGDCAVIRGQYHVPHCDVEQCPSCFRQLLSCGCLDE